VHVVEAVVTPREPPRAVAPGDAVPAVPPRTGSGTERVVALALAVMAAVLGVVYVDLARGKPPDGAPPFDFVNPLLSVQAGECVEVSSESAVAPASWLIVRAPGVVMRPFAAKPKIPGWISPRFPDPQSFPAFLVCDAKPARPAGKPAEPLPPRREEPLVFGLNGFGLPLDAMGELRDIGQTTVSWGGQRRRAYAVGLVRHGNVSGPWIIFMAKDVPALGTMERKYVRANGETERQLFRVPESCK
jgi:hypothetical protein